MTRNETVQLLAMMQAAYPSFYRNMDDPQTAVSIWHDRLKPYPADLVGIAFRRLLDECKFPPSIADVITRVKELTSANDLTPIDLWGIAYGLISRASTITAEEWEAQHPVIKRFFKSTRQLIELGLSDTNAVNTVTKGQFLKQAEMLLRQEELRSQISASPRLQELIAAAGNQLAMPSDKPDLKLVGGGER